MGVSKHSEQLGVSNRESGDTCKGLKRVAWEELEHDKDCQGGGYHYGRKEIYLSHPLKEDLLREPLCYPRTSFPVLTLCCGSER